MPSRPLSPCAHPGCGTLVSGHSRCEAHAKQQRRQYDSGRKSASQRGYNVHWRRARKAYLAGHPLCVRCEAEGKVTAANVVDHIDPHKGDQVKFWDTRNWQSLCKRHHDIKTATEDGGGWGRGD